MSFQLRQSGDLRLRRPAGEVSVADFKEKASAGLSFWRGWVIGLISGCALSYIVLSGKLFRPLL